MSILPFLLLLLADFPPTSCLFSCHQFLFPPCLTASCPSPVVFLAGWLLPQCPWVSLLALPEVTANPKDTGYFQVWNLTPWTCT